MCWLLGPGKKSSSAKGKRGELAGKEPFFCLLQNIVCNESPAYSHVRELLRTEPNPERIAKPSTECQRKRHQKKPSVSAEGLNGDFKTIQLAALNCPICLKQVIKGFLYVVCIEIHFSLPSRALNGSHLDCRVEEKKALCSIFIFYAALKMARKGKWEP